MTEEMQDMIDVLAAVAVALRAGVDASRVAETLERALSTGDWSRADSSLLFDAKATAFDLEGKNP